MKLAAPPLFDLSVNLHISVQDLIFDILTTVQNPGQLHGLAKPDKFIPDRNLNIFHESFSLHGSAVKINRQDQIDVGLILVPDKAGRFRIYKIQSHHFIVDNPERVDQEFGIETDQNILSFLFDYDLFVHGAKSLRELQAHLSVSDLNDDRFFVIFPDQQRSAVDTA